MKVEANKLVVDAQFRQLEPPMTPDACRRLEQLILSGSWYQPVQTWDQRIVTGYAQHDIGVRCHVKIEAETISAPDRLEATIQACLHHLSNPELTEEYKRYLIGTRYQAEHLRNQSRKHNPIRKVDGAAEADRREFLNYEELNKIYGISYVTAKRYVRYSKAIDSLRETTHGVVPMIMLGKIKLSIQRVIEISQFPAPDAQKILDDLKMLKQAEAHRYYRELKSAKSLRQKTIKDMPDYDPDAEVSSLTLTLPSWRETLLRVIKALETNPVTPAARRKLGLQIQSMIQPIADIFAATAGGKK